MARLLTRRLLLIITLVATLVLGIVSVAHCQDGDSVVYVAWVDSETFPWVSAYVTASTADGAVLKDLPDDAFVVFVDGERVARSLVQVERQEHQDLDLVLALDLSMPDASLGDAREAVKSFVDTGLGTGDRLALVTFDRGARLALELTNDRGEIVEALDDLEVGEPATSLNQAIVKSVETFDADGAGRRAVVVLTHALDDTSSASVQEAIDSARGSGVPVYVVGFGPEIEQPETLRAIAQSTGGQAIFLAFSDDLEDPLLSWERALRAVYRISFQSGLANDGEEHRLTIRVSHEGQSGQVKTAFVAPAREIDWLRVIIIGGVILLGGVLLVGLAIAVLAARSRRRLLEQRLRLEVCNAGNVRNRYELRAEEAGEVLRFRFAVGRRDLPVREVVRQYEVTPASSGATGPGSGDGRSPGARPGSGVKGVGKGIKEKGQQVKGVTGVISGLLLGVGTLLPGAMGAPLRNAAKKMKTGAGSVGRTVKIPKKKLGQVGRMRGQVSKLKPQGGQTGGSFAGGSGATRPEVVTDTEEIGAVDGEPASITYETAESWAQTPFVAPGESLQVDLYVSPPRRPQESTERSIKVFSRLAGVEEIPSAVEERRIRVAQVSWLRFNWSLLLAGGLTFFVSLACIGLLIVGLVFQR